MKCIKKKGAFSSLRWGEYHLMKKTSILGGALILMLVTAGCAPTAPASGQSETTAASNTDKEAAVPERTAEAGSEAAQATAANHTEAAASEYTGEADAGNAVMSSTENAGAAEAESAENTEGAEIVGQSYGTVDYDMVGEAVEGMKLTPNDELELVSARRVGPQFRIELRRLQPATGETEFGTSENIRTWEEGSLLNFTFWNKENLSELQIRTAKGEYLLSGFPKLAMEEIPLNASGENFTLQSMTRYDSAVI